MKLKMMGFFCLSILLITGFFVKPVNADSAGSCTWSGDNTTVTCVVGSVTTGEPLEGYEPSEPIITDVKFTSDEWGSMFPLSDGTPYDPTLPAETSTDPSTVSPFVNIDYSVLTTDENDTYTVHYLVDGVETGVTSSTSVTFTMPCSNGYEIVDGLCSLPVENVEEPEEAVSPTVTTNAPEYESFASGPIEDGSARRTIIFSLLIVIGSLAAAIWLYIKFGWGQKKNKKKKIDAQPLDDLKQEKEIEFKTRLTFAEYNEFLSYIKSNEQYEVLNQENWYFDTADLANIAKGIAVRIRRENNVYELCVKIKHETYNNELNVILSNDDAEKIITSRRIDLNRFGLDEYVVNHRLTYITNLTNLRYQYRDGDALIALDCSTYGDVEICELEMEYPTYERGKKYFESFLKAFNIQEKPIKPKVARALDEYRKKHQ